MKRTRQNGRLGFESLEARLALTAIGVDLGSGALATTSELADASSESTSEVNRSIVPAVVSSSQPPGPVAYLSQDAVTDFSRPDVNTTSSTFEQSISPRDYLQQVSAWYFGHAT